MSHPRPLRCRGWLPCHRSSTVAHPGGVRSRRKSGPRVATTESRPPRIYVIHPQGEVCGDRPTLTVGSGVIRPVRRDTSSAVPSPPEGSTSSGPGSSTHASRHPGPFQSVVPDIHRPWRQPSRMPDLRSTSHEPRHLAAVEPRRREEGGQEVTQFRRCDPPAEVMSSGDLEQARAGRESRPRGTAVAAEATSRLDALSRTMPGLAMLRSYRPALFGKDLVAGLVLTTLLVPQGMAYAELAGLPAITGLYTTILALLGYALFGPSRVLVLGPDSSLGPMIAAVVVPLVAADGRRRGRRRLRLRARPHGGCDHRARRRVQPRLHRRPSVEADPDRVHERPRAHDPRQPATQAVRVLRRCGRPDR